MTQPSASPARKKRPANIKKPVLTTVECEAITAALEGESGRPAATRRLRSAATRRGGVRRKAPTATASRPASLPFSYDHLLDIFKLEVGVVAPGGGAAAG